MALLLCLSLLSLAASAPLPQTNDQPVMEFTFTTPPPAAVNAFTFTMPGDSNPSTEAPLMDNEPIEPVETDPNSYNGYYSTDSAGTQEVQNMDDAILVQDTNGQAQNPSENAQQDDSDPTVEQADVDQTPQQDDPALQQSDDDTPVQLQDLSENVQQDDADQTVQQLDDDTVQEPSDNVQQDDAEQTLQQADIDQTIQQDDADPSIQQPDDDTLPQAQDPSDNAQQDDARQIAQQSDDDTVPVILYNAPEGAPDMADQDGTPENAVVDQDDAQSLQDEDPMVEMDSGNSNTDAPIVFLDDSAVSAEPAEAAEFSDHSTGPAVILNDQDPTDSNPTSDADYDSTGAVNAIQRDAPAEPIVMDELTSEAVQMDQDSDATVVVPVSTTVAPQNVDDEVVPLVMMQPVQAEPADDTPADYNAPQQDAPDGLLPASSQILADPVGAEQTLTMVNVQQNGANTAYQVINMTQSLAENLLLNISMPMDTGNLLQRLNYTTTALDYTDKLDVAMQLTGMAHNLMTQVDDQLDDLIRQ